MKAIIFITSLLISIHAFAVDTSGCSPLQLKEGHVVTIHSAQLKVQALRAPRLSCWNVNDSVLIATYQWLQSGTSTAPDVHFWLQVNEQAQTVAAAVECHPTSSLVLSPDTSGSTLFTCTAQTQVPLKTVDAIRVEIAPQVGCQWDTLGFQQNYVFEL